LVAAGSLWPNSCSCHNWRLIFIFNHVNWFSLWDPVWELGWKPGWDSKTAQLWSKDGKGKSWCDLSWSPSSEDFLSPSYNTLFLTCNFFLELLIIQQFKVCSGQLLVTWLEHVVPH
jgi:hypothetical protein